MFSLVIRKGAEHIIKFPLCNRIPRGCAASGGGVQRAPQVNIRHVKKLLIIEQNAGWPQRFIRGLLMIQYGRQQEVVLLGHQPLGSS